MNKEIKHLTLAEEHELDIKKIMNDINYLESIAESCDEKSVLEMFKTRNGLGWLSDRELITSAQFITANKRLEEIGKKFKDKCGCTKTII